MAEPSLNTWTVIFLIAASQGIFLAVLLVLKKSRSQYPLAALILLFSLCLLYYVAFWTNYSTLISPIFSVCLGFTYLYGPLAYFHLRSTTNTLYFHPIHFLPFALYLLYFLSYSYWPTTIKPGLNLAQVIVQNGHMIIYSVLIWKYLSNRKKSNGDKKTHQWRLQLWAAYTGLVGSFVLYYVLVFANIINPTYDYMISFASSFFIYFVGYKGFMQDDALQNPAGSKYENSSLSHSAMQSILTRVKFEMTENRVFLQSDLKLKDLAESTSLSINHISQSINQLEGMNFSDFVNRYRFEEAKSRLSNPDHHDIKLIDVAYDCGFNNKTSFYNVFRKFSGMTPSQFKESVTEPSIR